MGRDEDHAGAAGMARGFAVSLVLLAIALVAPAGSAAEGPQPSTAKVTEFSLPAENRMLSSIAEGPDGAMWFGVGKRHFSGNIPYVEWAMGRVSAAGKVSYFKLPSNSAGGGVGGVTVGPDGAIWYLTRDAIGRMTTSGEVTEFPHEGIAVDLNYAPGALIAGHENDLWFVAEAQGTAGVPAVNRITTTGRVTEFPFPGPRSIGPQGIAWGPDGEIWFASRFDSTVGHVSSTGRYTELPVAGQPRNIVAGHDGMLWFASSEGIGRIAETGELFPTILLAGGAEQIVDGPDGRLWFGGGVEGAIGRLGPTGTISQILLASSRRDVLDLASGQNGTIWYTAEDTTSCEGGGGTCMAFDASHRRAVIGRIALAMPKAAIRPGGSTARRNRAELEIACIDGVVTGSCRGKVRINIPNGPTVARRGFRLTADETKTIVVPIGRKGRASIRARGNRRLIAVTEIKGGQTARRRLAIARR